MGSLTAFGSSQTLRGTPAIFKAVSRQDPKPGRWILPLVVAGVIGFTYTFVNALEPAEVEGPPTTLVTSQTTTVPPSTSTTTTTTLPPETIAFLEVVASFGTTGTGLVETAQQLNDGWDARTIGFSDIRSGLTDLRAETRDLVTDLAGVEFPSDAASVWDDVVASAASMESAADEMFDGLVNSEGSQRRLAALENYKSAESSLQQALTAAQDAVGG